mmetsp:Transcript_17891/g.34906  ORF Transcript_17891/g.34906 Transcript_17891/m.34906 type:complete len:241 (-) Transcript_17891:495-1217(-)
MARELRNRCTFAHCLRARIVRFGWSCRIPSSRTVMPSHGRVLLPRCCEILVPSATHLLNHLRLFEGIVRTIRIFRPSLGRLHAVAHVVVDPMRPCGCSQMVHATAHGHRATACSPHLPAHVLVEVYLLHFLDFLNQQSLGIGHLFWWTLDACKLLSLRRSFIVVPRLHKGDLTTGFVLHFTQVAPTGSNGLSHKLLWHINKSDLPLDALRSSHLLQLLINEILSQCHVARDGNSGQCLAL